MTHDAETLSLVHAWALTRRDGFCLGFTDHDLPLAFEGIDFRPETGFAARALLQATGLSVANTEALGALSDDAITEADIAAGLYDGALVRLWQVDWQDVGKRQLRFQGNLGDIRRHDGSFQAEIRGLAERLNQPQGRVFQRGCSAVLGDNACRIDLDNPAYQAEGEITGLTPDGGLLVAGLSDYPTGWFAHGSLFVLGADARPRIIRADRIVGDLRSIGLWEMDALPPVGTKLRLVAGCDRQAGTCRVKFLNLPNFRGFPHIPGEDWLMAGVQGGVHDLG